MLKSGIKHSIVSIVAYTPKKRKSKQLYDLLKRHVTVLRKENLVTKRPSVLLKSNEGYVEIFEWKSGKSIDDAHKNSTVTKMWAKFNVCCEYTPLEKLEECKMMFANFKPLN